MGFGEPYWIRTNDTFLKREVLYQLSCNLNDILKCMFKRKNYNSIINKIGLSRSKNNINWMNLLRLAFKYAPREANKIIKKINADDKKISKQLQKLQD